MDKLLLHYKNRSAYAKNISFLIKRIPPNVKILLLFLTLSCFLGFSVHGQQIDFSLVTGTSFPDVGNGPSVAFADVDGDGDMDLLIMGEDNSRQKHTELFINDGTGNFTLQAGSPFEAVTSSSVAFADVDGDGDMDLLLTGRTSSGQRISKLYINNGSGSFTEKGSTIFEGVQDGSVAFGDIDGDGDMDVLITGYSASDPIAYLYENDGSGNFTRIMGTPFKGVYGSSVAFADIDGDGDLDVLITGADEDDNTLAKLYLNDGSGNFSEIIGTPFKGVYIGSVAFADIDNDGDLDVLITGGDMDDRTFADLYSNDGSGTFTRVTGISINPILYSSIAFADVDGDGDVDLLITGESAYSQVATLFENDGSGGFTPVIQMPFDAIEDGSVAFADIDNDGDLDVIIVGQGGSKYVSNLYRNNTCFPPKADVDTLEDIMANCAVDSIPYPTATSNCVGKIEGSPDVTFPITLDTTLITWTYDDGKGNQTIQTQKVVITPLDSTVSKVDDITLKANAIGNVSYQWIDCGNENAPIPGETNQVFTATKNGVYAVEVNSENCTVVSECITIGGLGIPTVKAAEFEIYPNPVKDVFTIKASSPLVNALLEVYSPLGRLIYKNSFSGDAVSVNLEHNAQGVYSVRINGKVNIRVAKY